MKEEIKKDSEWDDWYDNQLLNSPWEQCPECGHDFDDADFDFQICSRCNYNAEKKEYVK